MTYERNTTWHNEARRLAAEGLSNQEIADRVGMSKRRVSFVVRGVAGRETNQEHPLRNEVLDLWAQGKSSRAISTVLDITRGSVLGIVRRARRVGDPRAVERQPRSEDSNRWKRDAVRLYLAGHDAGSIAQIVQRELGYVRQALRDLCPEYRQSRFNEEPQPERVPEDTRDFCARLLGDPIPGMSALDEMKRRVPQRDRLLPRLSFLEDTK